MDVSKLNPLTPEVISKQATINIGTIGHVAHGKSSVVKGLSGISTIKFKQEKVRNITIKLGYANCKIYERTSEPPTTNDESTSILYSPKYTSRGSSHPDEFDDEHGHWELRRHISFVDCPGHDMLMATMLNGAAVMDVGMLLVAANEECPRPQTAEHLAAVEVMKLQDLIVLQNKIELIPEAEAIFHKDSIRDFLKGSIAQDAPIIPISAVLKYNLDIVCEYLCKYIPVPPRDFSSDPMMIIIRSFDINKPGLDFEDVSGGVAGGTLLKGILRIGDEVEIRPGIISVDEEGKTKCSPIITRISSLNAENNSLEYAVPGGLIGVGTTMDPSIVRGDKIVGHVLGKVGALPPVFTKIAVVFNLFKRLPGNLNVEDERLALSTLKEGEVLLLNVGSNSISGKVKSIKTKSKEDNSGKKSRKKQKAKIILDTPVCANIGDKVAISRKSGKNFRLIGYGIIDDGV